MKDMSITKAIELILESAGVITPKQLRPAGSFMQQKLESYVQEFNNNSSVAPELFELAGRIAEMVDNTLENVDLREDKRASRTAQYSANENVLRNWRGFLRGLATFEGRFGK